MDDICNCEDLIKVAIDTINEYLEGYKKDDVLMNKFIQIVPTTPNIVNNTNMYNIMKYDEFRDFFGPSMKEANKLKIQSLFSCSCSSRNTRKLKN